MAVLVGLESKSIQALESNSHIDFILIPDVNSALSLLLVKVLGIVINKHSLNLSKLSEESCLPHRLLLGELPWQPDDIEEVWNDHPELLQLEQVGLLEVRQLCLLAEVDGGVQVLIEK